MWININGTSVCAGHLKLFWMFKVFATLKIKPAIQCLHMGLDA